MLIITDDRCIVILEVIDMIIEENEITEHKVAGMTLSTKNLRTTNRNISTQNKI